MDLTAKTNYGYEQIKGKDTHAQQPLSDNWPETIEGVIANMVRICADRSCDRDERIAALFTLEEAMVPEPEIEHETTSPMVEKAIGRFHQKLAEASAHAPGETAGGDVLAELDNASPVWLIERGQPEGQSPPCWWNELTERWVFDAAEATHYDTRSCAERALAQRSGIAGVHSPWGHTSEHVFFRMDDAEDACSSVSAGRGDKCPCKLGKIEELAKKHWAYEQQVDDDHPDRAFYRKTALALRTMAAEIEAMRVCHYSTDCKYCGPFHPNSNVDCCGCDGFGRAPSEQMQNDPESALERAERAVTATNDMLAQIGGE